MDEIHPKRSSRAGGRDITDVGCGPLSLVARQRLRSVSDMKYPRQRRSRNLANGGVDVVYSDARTYVFQRTGPPGPLIALNDDIWNPNWTTVTCRTRHAAGTVMHDYTGRNEEDSVVDANGDMTFGIPPAANGRGYGFWAPAGLDDRITFLKSSCTQSFFGADDLDIGPATDGRVTVGRVWIEERSPIRTGFAVDTKGWTSPASSVECQIHDPHGAVFDGGTATLATREARASNSATATGWHTLVLESKDLPPTGSPFTSEVEYMAPQTITPEQF
jgi:alpha-amylase